MRGAPHGHAWCMGLFVGSLLLLPGVSACTLEEEPPLPARLSVWDMADDRIIDEVDLWTRGLDADCGLLRPNDLDDGRLVYVDQAGESRGVWMHEIGSDDPPRLLFQLGGSFMDLDLDGDRLSVYVQTHDGPDPEHHVFRVDVTTGEAEEVALEIDASANPSITDSLLYWEGVDRDHQIHLNVFDLEADEWVHRERELGSFGFPRDAQVQTMNTDWMVVLAGGRAHVYDQATEARHELEVDHWAHAHLDGDLLYTIGADRSLARIDLPGVSPEPLPDPPDRPPFRDSVFSGSLATLGQYSIDDEEATTREPPDWITDPDGSESGSTPAVSAVLVALAFVAVATLRRRC